jgi:hypothetical protein
MKVCVRAINTSSEASAKWIFAKAFASALMPAPYSSSRREIFDPSDSSHSRIHRGISSCYFPEEYLS